MKFSMNEKRFATIRQAAEIVGLSHGLIRVWVKRGQVPGFYAGDRFYVNVPKFREALEAGAVGDHPTNSGEATEDGGNSGGRFCGGDQPRPSEGGRGSVSIIGRG